MGQPAKALTAPEVRRLVALVVKGPQALRNHVIVTLSFKAGLRACEIAGLTWPMVLAADRRLGKTIMVAGSIAKNGSARSIPLHAELRQALQCHWRAEGRPQHGPVVRSQRGAHLRPRSVVHLFRRFYDQLGFTGCSSHSGRRTFINSLAKLIAKSGGSLRDVQELAGHRSLAVTEKYLVGDRDAQRRALRAL